MLGEEHVESCDAGLQQIDFNGHPYFYFVARGLPQVLEEQLGSKAISRRGVAAMPGPLQRLVLVLSLILGSGTLAKAQSTPNRVEFVQSSPSQTLAYPLRHALPLNSSVLLTQWHGNFPDISGFRMTENYERQNPNSVSPLQETNTSFVAESRLPVAKVWGARLQVNFFAVTLHTGNVMLGPLSSSDASQRARQFGQPRSTSLYGIGVRVPLGRDARWEGSTSLWRSLRGILHGESTGVLN